MMRAVVGGGIYVLFREEMTLKQHLLERGLIIIN